MIDPSGMDNKVKKWWESRREEILRSRMFWPEVMGGGASASSGADNGSGDGNLVA
jgi:hypothetical protein